MGQTQRSSLVPGLVVLTGGLLVSMAALERLSSPTLRALGGRELLIMAGLVIAGVAIAILGACDAAGIALLPNIFPSVIACLMGVFAWIDVIRIYLDSWRWYGDPAGPLADIPPPNNWALLLGGVLCFGGGIAMARLGVFARTQRSPVVSEAEACDPAKTHHANRWWMRDGSGSVLVWDDQEQAWSPWAEGRDPALPPGWS